MSTKIKALGGLDKLPEEIIRLISEYLKINEIFRMRSITTTLYDSISNMMVYKNAQEKGCMELISTILSPILKHKNKGLLSHLSSSLFEFNASVSVRNCGGGGSGGNNSSGGGGDGDGDCGGSGSNNSSGGGNSSGNSSGAPTTLLYTEVVSTKNVNTIFAIIDIEKVRVHNICAKIMFINSDITSSLRVADLNEKMDEIVSKLEILISSFTELVILNVNGYILHSVNGDDSEYNINEQFLEKIMQLIKLRSNNSVKELILIENQNNRPGYKGITKEIYKYFYKKYGIKISVITGRPFLNESDLIWFAEHHGSLKKLLKFVNGLATLGVGFRQEGMQFSFQMDEFNLDSLYNYISSHQVPHSCPFEHDDAYEDNEDEYESLIKMLHEDYFSDDLSLSTPTKLALLLYMIIQCSFITSKLRPLSKKEQHLYGLAWWDNESNNIDDIRKKKTPFHNHLGLLLPATFCQQYLSLIIKLLDGLTIQQIDAEKLKLLQDIYNYTIHGLLFIDKQQLENNIARITSLVQKIRSDADTAANVANCEDCIDVGGVGSVISCSSTSAADVTVDVAASNVTVDVTASNVTADVTAVDVTADVIVSDVDDNSEFSA